MITPSPPDGAVPPNITFLALTPAASGFHIRAALSLLFKRNSLPFPCPVDRGGPWLQKKPPNPPHLLRRPARPSPRREASLSAHPVAHDAGSADGGARRRALPIGATSLRCSSIAG